MARSQAAFKRIEELPRRPFQRRSASSPLLEFEPPTNSLFWEGKRNRFGQAKLWHSFNVELRGFWAAEGFWAGYGRFVVQSRGSGPFQHRSHATSAQRRAR